MKKEKVDEREKNVFRLAGAVAWSAFYRNIWVCSNCPDSTLVWNPKHEATPYRLQKQHEKTSA